MKNYKRFIIIFAVLYIVIGLAEIFFETDTESSFFILIIYLWGLLHCKNRKEVLNIMNLLAKIKMFLYKVFWIDKFEGKSKLFVYVGKFFMYSYIIFISFGLIQFIFSFDLNSLMFTCISILLYPIMYRIVIGIQRFIHQI